jgi:very-short-patch-repair endonuclease
MTVPRAILTAARQLRTTHTDAESFLWAILRNRRFCGFKFRRQHPVGGFILDFFCHEASLAIELDGGGHAEDQQIIYDRERTKLLESMGIRVMRFWNNDVLNNTEAVLTTIYVALHSAPSPDASRHPLPKGEGKANAQSLRPSPRGRGQG